MGDTAQKRGKARFIGTRRESCKRRLGHRKTGRPIYIPVFRFAPCILVDTNPYHARLSPGYDSHALPKHAAAGVAAKIGVPRNPRVCAIVSSDRAFSYQKRSSLTFPRLSLLSPAARSFTDPPRVIACSVRCLTYGRVPPPCAEPLGYTVLEPGPRGGTRPRRPSHHHASTPKRVKPLLVDPPTVLRTRP